MKLKTCKVCKEKFRPERQLQSVCSYQCSIDYANKHLSKKIKEKKKVQRKALKQFNDSDKTVLKRNAQMLVNRYSRFRDEYENGKRCCTCGITTGKFDGGHFLPTSGYSAIRYNTNQIHLQCVNCNQYNGGRYKEYRVFMINKYGLEYVENLEATKSLLKSYSVEYYTKLIAVVRKKIRKIEQKML